MSDWRLRMVATVLVALAACSRGASVPAPSPIPKDGERNEDVPLPEKAPRSGLEVIGWMRRAHPSRELKRLAFTMRATRTTKDTSEQRSRAYALLPGKMRVEAMPKSARTGTVRDRQRLAVFRRGRRVATTNRVDLRTLLSYDVFAQASDTTIMWLDTARVRFGLVRRDRFDGRSVWVVGAEKDDLTSSQFWVDADEWRVVRVIQREPRTPSVISDVRFVEYTEFLDVPVPTRIEIWRDGQLVETQELSEFAVNPTLPRSAFDLSRWTTVSVGN